MFIIKNGKYFDEENFPGGKGIRGQKLKAEKENYLRRLSGINNKVEFPKEPTLFTKEEEQKFLKIFDDVTLKLLEEPQARELENEFDQFYIVTYEIDETFAISNIRMLMPNPQDDRAYEIEDLSEYIGTSTVIFDEGDYEVLVDDGFDLPDSPAAADYGIVLQL